MYAACMTSKDDIIAELRELVKKQAKQIAALTQEVADLKLRLAKAEKDSSNSSKSPSSDIVDAGKDKKKKKPDRLRKRKIGGQPGHRRIP